MPPAIDYLPHYSYEEYRKWEGDWELIEGIPYAMAPSPGIAHQTLNGRLSHLLNEALEDCPACTAIPEIDWKIADDTVVRPDQVIVCDQPKDQACLTIRPDVIFEVLSLSTKLHDRNLKLKLYEEAGVPCYVLLDPVAKLAEIYTLQNGRYRLDRELKEGHYTFESSHEECGVTLDFARLFRF
ncbi:MAG: Uma2 family endonuclease [Epsilonproteobacteria bacterium]|nr:Uma2 family endonuclease [Campylobacterota bacterium]